MKYMLLIHQSFTREDMAALPPEEQQQLYAEWGALREIPGLTSGPGMGAPASATTVRVADGETLVTDGPFAQTKEAFAGIMFYECDNLDDAIEVAARIPAARRGGAIEIRPVVES